MEWETQEKLRSQTFPRPFKLETVIGAIGCSLTTAAPDRKTARVEATLL